MIGSMLVGTIIGVGFFTYKPLFSVLKKNKFSFKAAYNDYKENQETKEAFKTFAATQMDKVKRLVGSINDKTQKKFGTSTQDQEDTSSPSQTHKLEPATQDDNKATQSQNDNVDTTQQDTQNNNEQENTNKSQENTNQSKE
ncbi:hypothetical protein LS74_000190 [Helicobacter magdeburgensis]|uniref:Uncharacterized protein n=1 Tax=Helicobacter magdeburgensis TaxID=471858 RepID=A0A4U8T3D5_9HELI|nr:MULTISPECIES: hypothetical protein [Helicobacter]TLD93808.1 hypothetical protein LS74_000190 [Helicobacter magdeburgensis]BDB64079.1 hypothetical protein T36_0526 [Helicobacter cinaedi]BDB65256.1 hypothetical protein T36_1732 [Helicobacter cinaedi]